MNRIENKVATLQIKSEK